MLKYLIKRGIQSFARRYDYDATYMEQMADTSPGAFLKFSAVQMVSGRRADIPVEPWSAASIRAAMFEDCGPCVQLVSNMALEAGVKPELVQNIVAGNLTELPQDVALVVRFTEKVLARDPTANDLREAIVQQWGDNGLLSLAMTISASRVYPSLKYALGHGQACSRIQIEQQYVVPQKLATAHF